MSDYYIHWSVVGDLICANHPTDCPREVVSTMRGYTQRFKGTTKALVLRKANDTGWGGIGTDVIVCPNCNQNHKGEEDE